LLITDTTFLKGSTDQLFKKLPTSVAISIKRVDKSTFIFKSDTLNLDVHYLKNANNTLELDNFYIEVRNKTQRELQSMIAFLTIKTGNKDIISSKVSNSITRKIKINSLYNVEIKNDWLYGQTPPERSTISFFLSKNTLSNNSPDYETLDAWLSFGTNDVEVLEKLGKPQKGKSVYSTAMGTYVQEWAYPAQGITLFMESESENGEKKVCRNGIIIQQPCQLMTTKAIRIGTKKEIILQKYSKIINKEQSNLDSSIVCGSVYGGMIFSISNDTVSKIFIGDAAE
jgi:hypothetical protein